MKKHDIKETEINQKLHKYLRSKSFSELSSIDLSTIECRIIGETAGFLWVRLVR
jgi:hypothetical protein